MDSSPKIAKRQSPDSHAATDQSNKRQRTSTSEPDGQPTATEEQGPAPNAFDVSELATAVEELQKPNAGDIARDGLQRSIVLALQHVGFDSASQEALESLTSTVETYLMTFMAHLKASAESSRRAQPTPADFETMLRKHNIPLASLRPHLRNPVAKEKLTPDYYDPAPIPEHADYFRTPSTEFLGPDLDGNTDKQDRPWIPSSLPSFPSKHTYKFTPVETAAPDPEKKRAEATADARKAEKALRRIDRAAKMSKQKELKEMAQRNKLSRMRHDNWEAVMKAFLPQSSASNESQEIADHSVIVDYSTPYMRREVPKENRARGQS